MNFIELSSATNNQPFSSRLLSSRDGRLSSSGNVTSEASFAIRPPLPEPNQFKFMHKRKQSFPALAEMRAKISTNFLDTVSPMTTLKVSEPTSPTRTSSISPRPFKHQQVLRLPKPAGDPGEANLTAGSRSGGKHSAYRNSIHEKSSSIQWSFAQHVPSFLRSRLESRSNLQVPDSSRLLREGGSDNDQGMPIDTIVDCEELLLQNEQFMRYFLQREEEINKQKKKSSADNFLRLPFVPAVQKS